MSALDVPLELLRRYNVQGPRYTSYPTAPMWKEQFGATDYASILRESSESEAPAPLSLYFHLPFCETALLLLRLHGRDHRRPGTPARTSTSTPSRGRWIPWPPPSPGVAGSEEESRPAPLGRRNADLLLAGPARAPRTIDPRSLRRRSGRRARRRDRSARHHAGASRDTGGPRLQPPEHGRPGLRPSGPGGDQPDPALRSAHATSCARRAASASRASTWI